MKGNNLMVHASIALLICCALTFVTSTCYPQAPVWYTIGSGVSSDTSADYTLSSSIGGIASVETPDSLYYLLSGYYPGLGLLSTEDALLTVQPEAGWNLLSLQVVLRNMSKNSIFGTTMSPAYEFHNGYRVKDTLEFGKGYWVKFDTAQSFPIYGFTSTLDTVDVNDKWNLVGSLSSSVPKVNIEGIGTTIVSNFFSFTPGAGYVISDTLQPGKGYWVKVNTSGKLALNATHFLEVASNSNGTSKKKLSSRSVMSIINTNKEIHRLIITDATGYERRLYFSGTQKDIDPTTCELPPVPPKGFDVRFQSGRFLESTTGMKDQDSYSLRITNANYPVSISWDATEDKNHYQLNISLPHAKTQEIALKQQGMITLANEEQNINLIIRSASITLPKDFALHQNYPNPFNPLTSIRYDLPVSATVTLQVFNLLGQLIQTYINNQIINEGQHEVEIQASSLASGTYFYRLTATNIETGRSFTDTKTMMLIK